MSISELFNPSIRIIGLLHFLVEDNFKVLNSPISFSFKDKLFIETEVVKLRPFFQWSTIDNDFFVEIRDA